MAQYRIHIKNDEGDFQYENTVHATELVEEDGWTVFFQGNDPFMRIRDEHIVSIEHLV